MKTLKKYGGKVIGHGGFGCIFNPSLKCEIVNDSDDLSHSSKTLYQSKKKISKMIKSEKYLKEEYNEIQQILPKLSKIPHYKNYFILHQIKCKPLRITKKDMKNFKKECKKFVEYDRKHLMQLNTLVSVYGGLSVEKFVQKYKYHAAKMGLLHAQLINLLRFAIIPMNSQGVYHCDIKLDNMVYNNQSVKLIDWGFTSMFPTSSLMQIPHKFSSFPWHFNMPVTVVLFSDSVQTLISTQIKLNYSTETIATNIFNNCKDGKNRGHYDTLHSDYKHLMFPDDFDNHVINIFTEALNKYIVDEKFMRYQFFSEIYVHNVDLHGFVISLSDVVRHNPDLRIKVNAIVKEFCYGMFFQRIDKKYLIDTVAKIFQIAINK